MKKIIVILICLLSVVAQAQTRYVGYSTTDDIDVRGAAFGVAGTYTIGALLTPQQLAPYEGCRVLGMRVASAMNLGRTRMFLYSVADGVMTSVVEQRQRLYEDWNQVLFNGDGYLIQGTESLFFGFDYTETEEMVSAEEGGICGVSKDVDGGFYLYQNQRFYQVSNVGCLCIQLIVDVSSLPTHDLDMTYFETGFKYKKPGETIEALASFTNVGLEAVNGFQLGYQLDDRQPVYCTVTDSLLREGRTDSWLFDCELPADYPIGMHKLSVFVSQVNGEPLAARSKNDTLTTTFAVYEQSMQREKVYFEVYTDQTSPYVPYLDEAVKLLTGQMDGLMAVVNVHCPGTPLAIAEAGYLHELYAYDWPTFTVNRSYFPGEAHVAYDMNDYLPTIGADMSAAIIGEMVMQDYYNPAFAGLQLQADYDAATRQLSVQATGQLLPEAWAIYGDLALTLMLVENDVKSRQMVYNPRTQRSSYNENYLHQHVLRGYLTAPTGDAITGSGADYATLHTITVPEAWNADKLTIVALLTKKADVITDANMRDYDVINAQSLSLADIMQGNDIVLPESGAGKSPAFFTLDGKRTDNPRHGIYLQRLPDGSVRKVSVK